MAENPRQEIQFQFGGKTYLVRPDFATICAIEAALDQPSRTLGMKCYQTGLPSAQRTGPEISVMELATIVGMMLRDKDGGPKTPSDAGEIIMEDGYRDLLSPVGDYLMRAQRGHKEHEKEAARAAARSGPSKTGQKET